MLLIYVLGKMIISVSTLFGQLQKRIFSSLLKKKKKASLGWGEQGKKCFKGSGDPKHLLSYQVVVLLPPNISAHKAGFLNVSNSVLILFTPTFLMTSFSIPSPEDNFFIQI